MKTILAIRKDDKYICEEVEVHSCPSCHCDNLIISHIPRNFPSEFFVYCKDCSVEGPQGHDFDGIQLWNEMCERMKEREIK